MNQNREFAIRTYSFFKKRHFTIPDTFQFIRRKLLHIKLDCLQGCRNTTGVQWGTSVRKICSEVIWNKIYKNPMILCGEIQIDESLFGRKVKYHKGNATKGMRVWIFGMIEVNSNKLIIYPVKDRTKETLIPLIERHVAKGSTIYSDSWASYMTLNEIGYRHFTVVHKKSFKQTYKHMDSGEEVEVHTNRIEGAWKHMKDHFRRMNGDICFHESYINIVLRHKFQQLIVANH